MSTTPLALILLAAATAITTPNPTQRLNPTPKTHSTTTTTKPPPHNSTIQRLTEHITKPFGTHSPRGKTSYDTHQTPQHSARHSPQHTAADIDLFAACLRAGLSPAAAASIIANTTHPDTKPTWRSTASLLALGTPPRTAWAPMSHDPDLHQLAHLVTTATTHGSTLSEGLQRLAHTIRTHATTQAQARAEKAGVLIALPLAAFFLPAFMALGLAPIVISIGSTMLP